MANDFASLAGLAVTTIGTVAIAGEVVKAVRHTARQAAPQRRRMPAKRKNKNLNTIKIKW